MIHVAALLTAKPGQRDAVLAAFRANMPAVHAEPGCIAYAPFIDTEGMGSFQTKLGEDTFMAIEIWESAEALKAHAAAPHMAEYGRKVKDMLASRVIHVMSRPEPGMQALLAPAALLAGRLRSRGETVAVSESSTGGLIAAALLAQAGASAFFLGGAVVYTLPAREALLGITKADMAGMRSASEPYARLAASRIRGRLGAVWGLAETGAAGPSGNRYGDAAGHSCLAVTGPVEMVRTIETGSGDRVENMRAFAAAALALLEAAIAAA